MPVLSSTTRCHRVHLPTKNHQKIPLDNQALNAIAYFLPCNCMFLKCICNALAYAKVFQMSSFFKFTVQSMQLHDFLMQLHCKCIAQKCNCIANAFFGQRKENFPPHPLYKEKKKIKKRKLKKEIFLHQEAEEPGEVKKPKGLGPRARGNKKPFQPMKDWKGLSRKISASVLFRGRRFYRR